MNKKDFNKQCMEKILTHLTKLIVLMEYEDIKTMQKLVDMSVAISTQLIEIENCGEEYEECEE